MSGYQLVMSDLLQSSAYGPKTASSFISTVKVNVADLKMSKTNALQKPL
jgi:hypothetical protein